MRVEQTVIQEQSLDDEYSGSYYIISLHVCKSELVYNMHF